MKSETIMKSSAWGRRLLPLLVVLAVAGLPASAEEPSDANSLVVAEHSLGTSVENRALKGVGDRFPEGTQVFFWTRLTGGRAGDRIRHVWIHDGKEISVGLSVGAASWRTWSSKRLRAGSVGRWAVEVRDADGKVLAREEFDCTEGS